MKKFGFTLAEVLVTLGIIGVVSAMTIPSLSTNANNKANAAKLSATISTLETAISNMMADEGVVDIFDIIDYEKKITKYIKLLKLEDGDFGVNYEKDANYNRFGKTIDGNSGITGTDFKSGGMPSLLKNGAYVQIDSFHEKIFIDTNGDAKPNIFGRDMHYFKLSSEGKLLAFGSRALEDYTKGVNYLENAEHWLTSSNKQYACNDSKKGLGCTGRLVENNFVVDF